MKSLMKKLLTTVAMAVLSSAVWAEALQINITCTGIPVSFTKITADSYFCLTDPDKGQILAYVQPKEFDQTKTKIDIFGGENDYESSYANNVTHSSGVISINGNYYGVNEHTIAAGSTHVYDRFNGTWDYDTKSGTATLKDVVFKMTANSTNEDTLAALDKYKDQSSKTSLVAIIWDAENDFYQEYEVGVSGNSTPILFSANGPCRVLSMTAFSAEKIYDGLPTNATFTVSEADATITVAYGGSSDPDGDWEGEEEYDPVKFKDCVDTWVRFTATKTGYSKAEAIAHVWISPRLVTVTAPNLTFPLDADDDAIDAEIESKIDIEKAGLIPEHGVFEGDEITSIWAREDASYKDGSREEDVSYEIAFSEDNETYQGNYIVNYINGTLKFEEPEPVACPRCLCLCNCEKRTYTGTIVNNGEALFGTITLTMTKSTKAGHADVTATVKTDDGKTLTFKKNGVMICGCRDVKTSCTTKCCLLNLLCGLSSIGSQKLTEENYDYTKELGHEVEFYTGSDECTCGCGSAEGHDDECEIKKGFGRCYWAKKGRKCRMTCCKYDFGFGKSQCDFSHYDYTGCYKTKVACDWGKIGNDWDKYVCDWSKNSCTSSKKSCTSSKSICSLFKSFCCLSKPTCTPTKTYCWSKSTCTSSKTPCCSKKFFCWKKFTCKPVCVKKTFTCCKKTTSSAPKTRCIVLNPLVIEMEQTGLSFRQSATHALTISIVGDDMTGTLHTSDASYVIKGGAKVNLTSGDPRAEVAKNVTDTTYVVSFSREDADVTAGQFTVRVDGDGIVKASGTIDGLSYSGTSDLVINSYGGIEIPVNATDKKGGSIGFKIDVPAAEEADVVELNIAPVIYKGDVLVPAQIEIEDDVSIPALNMDYNRATFLPWTLED